MKVGQTQRESRNHGDGVRGFFSEASPISVRARDRRQHESTSVKSLLSETPMTAVKVPKPFQQTDLNVQSIWKETSPPKFMYRTI